VNALNGGIVMDVGVAEKNSGKAEILYRLLCMNREASTRYLIEAGKNCKNEDPGERKERYDAMFDDLVHAIGSSKKK